MSSQLRKRSSDRSGAGARGLKLPVIGQGGSSRELDAKTLSPVLQRGHDFAGGTAGAPAAGASGRGAAGASAAASTGSRSFRGRSSDRGTGGGGGGSASSSAGAGGSEDEGEDEDIDLLDDVDAAELARAERLATKRRDLGPWPNMLSMVPSTAASRLPLVHFTPVSPTDNARHVADVLRRRRAAERGPVVPGTQGARGSIPFSVPRGRKAGHVSSCTCPQCRRNIKARKSGPVTMFYKMNNSGVTLVNSTFKAHGFRPTTKDSWNGLWTSSHLKSYIFQGLQRWQKVNQFPRSYEVTRKDNLARNIRRMQQLHGERHFEWFPQSFVLPADVAEFREEWAREKGKPWIVKPSQSSRGRGIFITQHWDIATERFDEGCTVSRYIDNPLLLDGFKFDLRLYVAVTSFHPLRIYVHEEGLARFATEPYDPDPKHYDNHFMHLTNYSINKLSSKFVGNDDELVEDAGHKWSMTALRRRLRKAGIDDDTIWEQINELIVKSVLAVEPQVMAAVDMFVPHHSNCYELFGFDVMIDDTLTPYLLEVNFAPSLACDAPLDHHIKSRVLSELMTLAGFPVYDPVQASLLERERAHAVFKGRGPPPATKWDVSCVAAATRVDAASLVVPAGSGTRRPVRAGGGGGGRKGGGGGGGASGGAESKEEKRDLSEAADDADGASDATGSVRGRGGGSRGRSRASKSEALSPGGSSGSGGRRGRSSRRLRSAEPRHGKGAGASKRSASAHSADGRPGWDDGGGLHGGDSRSGRGKGGRGGGGGRGRAGDGGESWAHMESTTRNHMLADLSAEERRAIRETEEEYERRGSYQRIFPTARAFEFMPFFEGDRPLNRVVADYVFRVSAAETAVRDEEAGAPDMAPLASSASTRPGSFLPHHVMAAGDVRMEQARAARRATRTKRVPRSSTHSVSSGGAGSALGSPTVKTPDSPGAAAASALPRDEGGPAPARALGGAGGAAPATVRAGAGASGGGGGGRGGSGGAAAGDVDAASPLALDAAQ